jgi:hypothetical protein
MDTSKAMNLDFDKKRRETVRDAHRDWWNGKSTKPLIHLTADARAMIFTFGADELIPTTK